MNNEVKMSFRIKGIIKSLEISKVIDPDKLSHEGKPKTMKSLAKDVFWADFWHFYIKYFVIYLFDCIRPF